MNHDSDSRTFRSVLLLAAAPFGFAQRGPIEQQLTFTPYHASGIYDVGETVGWTVTPGPVTPTYAYKWTIRRNNAVVLKEGKLDLSSGKDKIEITGDQPEMIYVAVEPYAQSVAARRRFRPAPCRVLRRRQYRPQQRTLRRRRRRRAGENRALDAASRRFRRVLGRQTGRAGQSPDQPRADAGSRPMCRASS